MSYLTIGQAAKRLGIPPPKLSGALYGGKIREDFAPKVGDRRMVAEADMEALTIACRRAGLLPALPHKAEGVADEK